MDYQASRAGWRRMALVCLVACVVVSGTAGVAPAQESNLDVMTTLTRDVVTEIITKLDAARGDRGVRLVGTLSTEEYRFIENVFTSVLDERGVQVYTGVKPQPEGPGQRPENILELRFEATEFSVVYPKIFRTYLIGGKKVRREAVVTIVGTLVDPASGAVLSVAEASRETSGQFGHGEIGVVERGTFEFVRPPVPSSGWNRVVEPVFVSGIIVGLIYLFFSNQSDE